VPIDVTAVAAAALREPVVRATVTGRTAIVYDPFVHGRSVDRLVGDAIVRSGSTLPWTAIVKGSKGPSLRAGLRELAAYRAGVAPSSAASGLRAPALLGSSRGEDDVEVWLEAIEDDHGGSWSIEQFERSAEDIGLWDADPGRPDPADLDWEDAWAERHGQPELVDVAGSEARALASMNRAEELMSLLDDHEFARTQALIRSTGGRIQQLAGYAGTVLHHDLVRSNLFAVGPHTTVAIDWENIGHGPLGVDLAPLVVGSVRRGEASSDDLPALESAVLTGYLRGLRVAGLDREEDIRTCYRLAVGLRWHVVLGTIRTWLDPGAPAVRGSRPDEPRAEALRHLVAVARYILDLADRAE